MEASLQLCLATLQPSTSRASWPWGVVGAHAPQHLRVGPGIRHPCPGLHCHGACARYLAHPGVIAKPTFARVWGDGTVGRGEVWLDEGPGLSGWDSWHPAGYAHMPTPRQGSRHDKGLHLACIRPCARGSVTSKGKQQTHHDRAGGRCTEERNPLYFSAFHGAFSCPLSKGPHIFILSGGTLRGTAGWGWSGCPGLLERLKFHPRQDCMNPRGTFLHPGLPGLQGKDPLARGIVDFSWPHGR